MYDNSFSVFLHDPEMSVLGVLHDHYHGDTRTTTTEAWKEEIQIMRSVVSAYEGEGHIIFEYQSPEWARTTNLLLFGGTYDGN